MKMNPYERLDRTFHEPKRLAIMSALCARQQGLSFNELKEECDLTDGNLNRHLKTLKDAKAIKSRKVTGSRKTQTRVFISEKGLQDFTEYLTSLESVLAQAVQTLSPVKKPGRMPSHTGLMPEIA